MSLVCPTCSKRAERDARYCRDCYTVFPFEMRISKTRRKERDSTNAWTAIPLILLIAGGVWAYQTGLGEPDKEEEKRVLAGVGRETIASSPPAKKPVQRASATPEQRKATRAVSRSNIRRSENLCIINQDVHNRRSHSAASVAVSFTFKDLLGKVIGQSVEAVAETGIPAGEGRQLAFEVPCPDTFTEVHVSPRDERIELKDPPAPPQAARSYPSVGRGVEREAKRACPSSSDCPVIIRFSNGEVASFVVRRQEQSSARLVPADGKANGLLKKHGRATLELRLPGGERRSLSISKAGDNRWVVSGPAGLFSMKQPHEGHPSYVRNQQDEERYGRV